ncbi:MAG: sigma-E factor negative regulatory protein [Pseudomonadota bacterium]
MSYVFTPDNQARFPAAERERISALVDGQLQGDEFEQALKACERDPELMACWSDFHLIGEVLRSPIPDASRRHDAAFVSRLQERLKAETVPSRQAGDVAVLKPQPRTAANDSLFRWKALAGFASLAAVAAVSWVSLGIRSQPSAPELAQAAPEQVLVASPQGTMVRDARLEELLAAHKQFGGTSALQMPSGFLRNATFETPQSAKR